MYGLLRCYRLCKTAPTMKSLASIAFLVLLLLSCRGENTTPINRQALVTRNCPTVNRVDKLSSLSVGNGSFAFTVDATGLQTFPEHYASGVYLGTQASWGWHSFPNPNEYKHTETLKEYNFRGKPELYAIQSSSAPQRQKEAIDWYRINPHRLHLGVIGLELPVVQGAKADSARIQKVSQRLNLWEGHIESRFELDGNAVEVQTVCHPTRDEIAAQITTPGTLSAPIGVNFRFGYPTGQHSDDTCRWDHADKHTTTLLDKGSHHALLVRKLDETTYYVQINWEGDARLTEKAPHYFVLLPEKSGQPFAFSCRFSAERPSGTAPAFSETLNLAKTHWKRFWESGGAVDFSQCKAPEAAELERRVVLSQYLMAIQCASDTPPQETGLTFNSWYGRPHLEMHWWHGVHFALWGRGELLERSLPWYQNVALPVARAIAQRQGFEGVRWMKMTDPLAGEAPSSVGSFLVWQQPHIIYFAELLYRANPSPQILEKYKELVMLTARFMASFATFDSLNNRYVLKGLIPAQETLKASETINPPFELSYWHFALEVAQKWRERTGMDRDKGWDRILKHLSPLTAKDGLYLAAETAPDTYTNPVFTSDHMAVLGALGILPQSPLAEASIMRNTLQWVWDNWNWNKTWGWDYPMTAMCAARLGEPEKAVGALLMDRRTNTYLVSGHNYQDDRLRIYLPGNGGLLTAVAMMCAGWEGSEGPNPGFPKDGNWDVKWEGLMPMP